MENTKILFLDEWKNSIEVFANGDEKITIIIEDNIQEYNIISLNKLTAIKFVKELKRQIGKLSEMEASI